MNYASPLIFERHGTWRIISIGVIFGITLFFPGLLIFPALQKLGHANVFQGNFVSALLNSFYVVIGTAIAAFTLGSIGGTISGLYEFSAKRFLLLSYCLPLVVPPFLLAIGLDSVRLNVISNEYWIFRGFLEVVLSFSFQAISFVLLGTMLSTWTISKNQIELLRTTRRETDVFLFILRQNLSLSALLAIFFSLLTITDPGPGQIFGYPGISTELLVSLSALYDFDLAALQSLIVSVAVLSLSLLVIAGIKKHIDSNFLLDKSIQLLTPYKLKQSWPVIGFAFLIFFLQALPIIGILWPMLSIDDGSVLFRAWNEACFTFKNSALYSLGGASISVCLGICLIIAVGRVKKLQSFFLVAVLAFFSVPSFLSSIGMIHLGTTTPYFLDWLTRSRFSVALILGLKFLPVASLILFYGYLKSPRSWAEQAAICRMTSFSFLSQVILPWLRRHAFLSFLFISLLISSEINTVLLLRPPGEDSFPIRIFTVMANSSEAFVTSLCFVYLTGSFCLLGLTYFLFGLARRE